VLGQNLYDPVTASARGFAADAGVDYPVAGLFLVNPLLEERHPALVGRNAVGCGKAVAEYQNDLRGLGGLGGDAP